MNLFIEIIALIKQLYFKTLKEAVALRMRYTKYSDNLMTNLLYLVVLLLIATAP